VLIQGSFFGAQWFDYPLLPFLFAGPSPAFADGMRSFSQSNEKSFKTSYMVYAEAMNGAVDPSQVSNAIDSLCRNTMTDPGWPPLQGCVVPEADISFTTRTRPGP
jgi:hypothetical protein